MKTKAAIAWQAGKPLTIEEVEQSTRISCSKCKKFIQGRFQP